MNLTVATNSVGKTESSAQSVSNKCKNYLLKIYSYSCAMVTFGILSKTTHLFISQSDSAIKFSSSFEKVNVKPHKNA